MYENTCNIVQKIKNYYLKICMKIHVILFKKLKIKMYENTFNIVQKIKNYYLKKCMKIHVILFKKLKIIK